MIRTIAILALICLLTACGLLSETTGEETSPAEPAAQLPTPTAAPAAPQPSSPAGPVTYVGQANCSDSGPGSAQTPFCSFETALNQLRPGDTLTILPGLYRERLVITGLSGRPDAPIVIQGQEGTVFDGNCPAFPCGVNDVDWDWDDETGLIAVEDSRYLVLRRLKSQNTIAVGVSIFGGDHITVEEVTVENTGNAGLLARHTEHLTVIQNDICRAQSGWRDEDGDPQVGAHEAMSIVAVTDFEVAYNTVHDTLKEGIDVKESSARGAVHHNRVERACSVGIYINEAQEVQVHDNQVLRSGYFLTADGRESLCENHPVYGPFFGRWYGIGIQLAVGDLGDLSQGYLARIDLYRNLIWEAHGNGIEFWDEWRESGTGEGQMTDNRVYNNTIYRTGLGGIRLQDVDNTLVVNNILALNDEDAITGDAIPGDSNHGDNITGNEISHNLFFFQHNWQQAAGSDVLVGDPRFVDPENGDFHLQAGSTAIDAGLDLGLPFAGAAPDIGAYEHELPAEGSQATPRPGDRERAPSNSPLAAVSHWFYMIDVNLEAEMIEQMAASDYDMVVLDYIPSEADNTDYPMAQVIGRLHDAEHPKLVLAYIDIGEAEEYRSYWQPNWEIGDPEWIVGDDPDGWAENYPVAFWYDEWHDIWLGENGYLQTILEAGFDGVYLDWVEAYSDESVVAFAQEDGVDPRQEMIWWVGDIAEFTRSEQPDFIVIAQNAAELAENSEYLEIIDAIAQEQVWFDGGADNDPPGDCPLPRTDADVDTDAYRDSLSPPCRQQYEGYPESTLHVSSEEYLHYLIYARDQGTIIFTVDYALEPQNVAWVYETSRALRFVPFASNRALNQYVEPFD